MFSTIICFPQIIPHNYLFTWKLLASSITPQLWPWATFNGPRELGQWSGLCCFMFEVPFLCSGKKKNVIWRRWLRNHACCCSQTVTSLTSKSCSMKKYWVIEGRSMTKKINLQGLCWPLPIRIHHEACQS